MLAASTSRPSGRGRYRRAPRRIDDLRAERERLIDAAQAAAGAAKAAGWKARELEDAGFAVLRKAAAEASTNAEPTSQTNDHPHDQLAS